MVYRGFGGQGIWIWGQNRDISMGSWLKVEFSKKYAQFSKIRISDLQECFWKIPSQGDPRDIEHSFRYSGIGVPSL